MGLKNEFEIAVVNEPSVFEPLKFYCMAMHKGIFIMQNSILKRKQLKQGLPVLRVCVMDGKLST